MNRPPDPFGLRFFLARRWSRLPIMTRALPGYIREAFLGFLRYGTRQSAALAYYAVFSIFPLSLLLAVGISRLVGPVFAQQQIQLGLNTFLPPAAEAVVGVIEVNIAAALEQSRSFGVLAIVGLGWSALGLFANITTALDHIFHVPQSRSLWHQRLIAVLMSLILLALVAASFLTSGVLRLLTTLLLERPTIWLTIGTFFLPLGFNLAIFALLFRYVPARVVDWDAVWPAAMIGAVGWELAKSAFGWYLETVANFQFVYGGLATAIVLLFWAYIIAAIFLLSAELCAHLNAWLEVFAEPEPFDAEDLPDV